MFVEKQKKIKRAALVTAVILNTRSTTNLLGLARRKKVCGT